ncbi:type I methionyl aminopeptidase [Verrucomicrobiota bacterium]
MIIVKSESDLDRMRVSGKMAARVRDKVVECISPGVTTAAVADYAGELIGEMGGESAFLGYRGYPGQICVSVNEVVVHGIPGSRRIELGDIVSVDIGVRYDGFVGDTATTVMVGVTDQRVISLVRATERALEAGIAKAGEGHRVSDISHAIESEAVDSGYSVVRDFVGHGIGRSMHEEPQIPNFGRPGRGSGLKKGMTLALEPMVNMGAAGVVVEEDGWTVRTEDREPSAHFEHTVAVTGGAAEILTL